jgi:hypothetical protein
VKVCRETFNKNHLVNNRLDKAFIDEQSEESFSPTLSIDIMRELLQGSKG